MSLVVEDGTGKATAESYISVADATTYFAARGNATWAAVASDTVREQLLRKATDFMVEEFRTRWKGYKNSVTQALDWPRSYVYLEPVISGYLNDYPQLVPNNIVPTEVQRACAELALRAISGDLAPDITRTKSDIKVGPISISYDPVKPVATVFRKIEASIKPYLVGNGVMTRLERT